MKVSKEELTKILHSITLVINDSRGIPTAEYRAVDYVGMFECRSPEENHRNWVESRLSDGWVYGDKKDVSTKTHPCLVHYKDLPEREKIKDLIAQGIINYYNKETGDV